MAIDLFLCPKCESTRIWVSNIDPEAFCKECGHNDWIESFKKIDKNYVQRHYINNYGIKRRNSVQ